MAGSEKAMEKKHPSKRGRQLANASVIEKSQKQKAAKKKGNRAQ